MKILAAYKNGHKVAEYPIEKDTTAEDIEFVLAWWHKAGRSWEHKEVQDEK
ncbi:MAG: hypothetical protein KKE05_04160 [Nanoarchaeota archaeon]|nr:hypothetical protein [Nanoarchaeota archaeon]